MKNIKHFFLFCSGVDQNILYKVPSDENKYVGIGGTVFFTGVLAFFSSAYALYTVFDNPFMAIAFGIVWGLMIFNLDRYIVASMKSRGSFFGDLVIALPRLGMAILLALVISKPLELKIFEKEINAELLVMEQEVMKTQEDRVKDRYLASLDNLREEVVILKKEIADKTATRDELAAAALAEADGTGGSQLRNMGPIYRAKKAKADDAQAELDAVLAVNNPAIALKQASIQQTTSDMNASISSLDHKAYGGFAARIEALDRLGEASPVIATAAMMIMLLFITVETAPILVKLISPSSPYDHLLAEHEIVYEVRAKEGNTKLRTDLKNKIKLHTELGYHRTLATIEKEKAVIDARLKRDLHDLALDS